ncbi:hypothetical protein DEI82_08130 [Curtobacterium sp. MCBD17_019]|nr:hypothetical protein DEI82_08130 [Curtobacterium sp. MCBD17_019]
MSIRSVPGSIASGGRSRSSRPRHPTRPNGQGLPQPVRPTLFHRVAEWTRTPVPGDAVCERRVWIAFDERLVSYSECEGETSHTAVWCVDEFLQHFADRLDEDDASRWLLPHLERLASTGGGKAATLRAYAARHDGAPPPTVVCDVVL